MTFDVDRYYTPPEVATRVLERGYFTTIPAVCADSACGTGRLLEAAHAVFAATLCIGVDRDRFAIEALRRRKPSWLLSVGNLLNPASYRASQVARSLVEIDLLLLNPPFSQGEKRSLNACYDGRAVKASLAMTYILRSLELLRPVRGAIAIVPESLLYSDLDAKARELLSERFEIKHLCSLRSTTFSGTRARATAVQICAKVGSSRRPKTFEEPKDLKAELIRGALPVHLMRPNLDGIPFLHTTDFSSVIAMTGGVRGLRRTQTVAKGRVRGWVVLLPRVGVPALELIAPVQFKSDVQLSDCVIAVKCNSRLDAKKTASRLKKRFGHLVSLYRGTAARYITVRRLFQHLKALGLDARIAGLR